MEKETLYRYVACQASPEEETAVLTWLEADPAHESELAKVQRQHDLVALSAPVINELYAKDRRRRFGSVLRRWSAAAAAPTWPAPSPPSCWSRHRVKKYPLPV